MSSAQLVTLGFGLGGIGPMEWCIIGFVAVLIFGNRLPAIARSVGGSFVEFKRGLKGIDNEVKETVKEANATLEEVKDV